MADVRKGTAHPDAGVVSLFGQEFAAGQVWQIVSNPSDLRREMKRVGRESKADFFCERTLVPTGVQFGLGWKADGHGSGMPSLAAAATNSLGGNWVGAFQVGNMWWFCAAKSAVLPGMDVLLASETEAMKLVMQEVQEDPTWHTIIAPDHWGIPGAQSRQIEDVIRLDRVGTMLRPIEGWKAALDIKTNRGLRTAMAVGAPLLVVAGLLLGWSIYEDQQAEQEAQAAIQRARQAEIARRRLVEANKEAPWEKQLRPSAILSWCRQQFATHFYTAAGWIGPNFTCSPVAFSIAWMRDDKSDGDMVTLRASMARYNVVPSFSSSGNVASFGIQQVLPADLPRRGKEVPWRRITLDEFVWRIQQARLVHTMTLLNAVDPQVEAQQNKNGEPWRRVNMSIETALPPDELGQLLDALPTVVLENIQLQVGADGAMTWSLTGGIYESVPR